MRNVIEDLRYGLRLLRNAPAFTTIAIVTLGLGIGASTAIYTLLDQELLRPLPVKEPNRLVLLRFSGADIGSTHSRGDNKITFSYPMYRDLRGQNSVFSGLIASYWTQAGIAWHNQPELADTELVSGNYFDVLGVRPTLGRLFVAADDVAQEANPVVVLSFNYWQRRFGADPQVLNQSISINGHPFTIIGVAPREFHSVVAGDNPSIFVPMMMKPEITPGWNELEDRRTKWLDIIGRLKPGLTRQQAQAGIAPLWHSIRAQEWEKISAAHPNRYAMSSHFRDAFLTNSHLSLEDGAKGVPLQGSVPTTLLIVMGMAVLMALMSAANVASLLLVRMARRTREISLRFALGGQRKRLFEQLLTEGVLLGVLGGALGVALAPQVAQLLIRTIWAQQANHLALSASPDLRILGFNFGLSLAVSVLFSLAPALQLLRPDLVQSLKQQSTTIRSGSSVRRASVAAQIAISLLILIGAGLFVRTLHNLKSIDVGFVTQHLVTFRLDPSLAGYPSSQTVALYERILEKLSHLPGIDSAAVTSDPELASNNWGSNITVAGYRPTENEDMNVEWGRVSAEYFRTLRMPLLAGRPIEEQDRAGTHKVALVNESFARHYFAEPQDAVGHYFCEGAGTVTPDIEIVGVVKDAKHTSVRDRVLRTVFTPYLQEKQLGEFSFGMTFYVRTWQSPESAEPTIRSAVQALDRRLVLDEFHTMREQVDENVSDERAITFLATSFGLLAIAMAAIGVYGVLAYSIAQRTREIGIRIAIGATPCEVTRMVLAELVPLVGIGLALGLPVSQGLARVVRNQLFGIATYDPLTVLSVCLLIVFVALLSAALPVGRASRVDPMAALRYE
jgi:predicted permease